MAATWVKIHTLLNSKTSIPEFIFISEGDVHDVNILDKISIKKGCYYAMDKEYVDFDRLYSIHLKKAFFVIRTKENLKFNVVFSKKINKKENVKCDQEIGLDGFYSNKITQIHYEE